MVILVGKSLKLYLIPLFELTIVLYVMNRFYF